MATVIDRSGNTDGPDLHKKGWLEKIYDAIVAGPSVSATSIAKNEDAVHASSDVGVFTLGVANEAGTNFGADGDYVPTALRRNGVALVEQGPFLASRKTADGQVKAGAGFIHSIAVAGLTATPTAGLLTVYDSLTEANTIIYSEWVFATVVGHSIILDVPFATGCYVGFDATLANVQVTVSYR